jgi:antitoxin component YwqK of YwqJK toxin-antitoxin module
MWTTYYLFYNAGRTDTVVSHSGSYIEDNPDGKHIWYDEEGKIRDEGVYVNGKREGDWYKYNPDGTVFLVITYRGGSEIKYDGMKLKPPFEAEDQ